MSTSTRVWWCRLLARAARIVLLPLVAACGDAVVYPEGFNRTVVLAPDEFTVSTTCNGYPQTRQFSLRDAETGAFILTQPVYRLSVDSTFATVSASGLLEHRQDVTIGTPGTYGDNAYRLRYLMVATTPGGETATAEITQVVCTS